MNVGEIPVNIDDADIILLGAEQKAFLNSIESLPNFSITSSLSLSSSPVLNDLTLSIMINITGLSIKNI